VGGQEAVEEGEEGGAGQRQDHAQTGAGLAQGLRLGMGQALVAALGLAAAGGEAAVLDTPAAGAIPSWRGWEVAGTEPVTKATGWRWRWGS
jgi:hypothetical protein